MRRWLPRRPSSFVYGFRSGSSSTQRVHRNVSQIDREIYSTSKFVDCDRKTWTANEHLSPIEKRGKPLGTDRQLVSQFVVSNTGFVTSWKIDNMDEKVFIAISLSHFWRLLIYCSESVSCNPLRQNRQGGGSSGRFALPYLCAMLCFNEYLIGMLI